MVPASPRRGEVWIVDTGWQGKVRPCLVLSVSAGESDRDLITFIPRTTSKRGSAFEVQVDASFFQLPGVFDVQGIGTITRVKFQKKIGELTAEQLGSIEKTLKQWLGLD